MADIKGISYKSDNVNFLSANGGVIDHDITIYGDCNIDGNLYAEEIIEPLKIVTFADGTDEEIAAMLDAHYRGDINIEEYWHVGDTRLIHLNEIASPNQNGYTAAWSAQNITIVITAINHHDLKENIGIRDKAAITVQPRECLNGLSKGSNEDGCVFVNLNNNLDKTFTKWSELFLRTWMNNQFLTTCFSDSLQKLIKETKHNRLTQYNTKITEEVIDKLFLPSYPEIFGNTSYQYYLNNTTPTGEEGTQWDYYKISSNRIKKGNNNGSANSTSCYWWEGSASSYDSSSYGYRWCIVNSDGSASGYNGNIAGGLAPAFCL